MQKFVVVKKSQHNHNNNEMPDVLPPPTKVKMSGYLKKKRSKVGGWRKMWFVLQNQLLLSYPSKEEYDNKLGSFKDVLNLVPGTIVRPLGGFRFTIETTTNIIYTFRCDDSKDCTLWITALIESLSMQGQCAKENGIGKSSKFHNLSMGNIKQMIPQKKVVRTSYSWDSLCRLKGTKFPRIPIAQNTARLLERNGLSALELSKIHQNLINSDLCDKKDTEKQKDEASNEKRARNFRLHEKRLAVSSSQSQSDEVVNRINKMFTHNGGEVNGVNFFKNSNRAKDPLVDYGWSNEDKSNDPGILDKNGTNSNFIIQSNNCCSKRKRMDKIQPVDLHRSKNNSSPIEGGGLYVKDKIEQFFLSHVDGMRSNYGHHYGNNSSLQDILCDAVEEDEDVEHCNIHGHLLKDFQNKMNTSRENNEIEKQIQQLSLKDSSIPSASSHSSNGMMTMSMVVNTSSKNEMVDGTVFSTRLYPRLSASSDDLNKVEPIYAVVDLKNKYAHRAKIREMEKRPDHLHTEQRPIMDKERPKSIHVVSSDYEEVLNFSPIFIDKEDDENENLYEPIAFADNNFHCNSVSGRVTSSNHSNSNNSSASKNSMWRYFPKLNLDTLIEMAKNRRKDEANTKLTNEFPSTFADIRRKLGNHRKSIKNRMRRFYVTKDSSPYVGDVTSIKERNAFSDDELDSQGATCSTSGTSNNSEKSAASLVLSEIEKYRRGEKHIFGSLSKSKKTRASLCLEDHNQEDMDHIFPQSTCFIQDHRKGIAKKSKSKKPECHSKFYD